MDLWIYGLVNLRTCWWTSRWTISCIPVQEKGKRRIIGCLVRNVWNFCTFLFNFFQISIVLSLLVQLTRRIQFNVTEEVKNLLRVTFEIKTDNYWNNFVNICHSNPKRGRYLFTIVQQLKVFKNVDNPPCLCQAWEGKSQVC